MSDLSLVPTTEILEELKGRFDHVIFAGTKIIGLGADTTLPNEHMEAWSGHVTFCAGMAMDLIRTMQDWTLDDDEEN